MIANDCTRCHYRWAIDDRGVCLSCLSSEPLVSPGAPFVRLFGLPVRLGPYIERKQPKRLEIDFGTKVAR